jgi:Protein of unknown function (DUF3780)
MPQHTSASWIGLRPEERWWLFNITAAATGYVEHADIGWRKALRFALTENPLAELTPEQQRSQAMASLAKTKRRKTSARGSVSDSESDQLFLLNDLTDDPSPFHSPEKSGNPT